MRQQVVYAMQQYLDRQFVRYRETDSPSEALDILNHASELIPLVEKTND